MVVTMTDEINKYNYTDKKWVRTNCLVGDGEATEADGVCGDDAFDGT